MSAVTDVLDTLEHVIKYLDANRNVNLRVAASSNISLTDPNARLHKFGLLEFKPVSMSNAFSDEKFILKNHQLFPYYSYRFVTEFLFDLLENILLEYGYIKQDISAEHFLYLLTVELKSEYVMMELAETNSNK